MEKKTKTTKNNEKNNVDKKERPQNKNLKPIQPGETRNPNGRPKGKLNYDTRVDMAIEALALAMVAQHNKKKENKGNQITVDDIDIEGDIFMQHLNKARAGDSKAMPDFLDRRHGKATQRMEITGKDGNPIEYKERIANAKERMKKFQDRWFISVEVKKEE